jgi:hypothetical protein
MGQHRQAPRVREGPVCGALGRGFRPTNTGTCSPRSTPRAGKCVACAPWHRPADWRRDRPRPHAGRIPKSRPLPASPVPKRACDDPSGATAEPAAALYPAIRSRPSSFFATIACASPESSESIALSNERQACRPSRAARPGPTPDLTGPWASGRPAGRTAEFAARFEQRHAITGVSCTCDRHVGEVSEFATPAPRQPGRSEVTSPGNESPTLRPPVTAIALSPMNSLLCIR